MKYHTRVIKIADDEEDKYAYAASLIREGDVVAFPTETVYGLGANALSESAILKIFEAKNRPMDNPLIVHVSDRKMMEGLVTRIPEKARLLMDKFWPGPLTILMPKGDRVPPMVTCGNDFVGIRMPKNEIARDLIRYSNVPIAAPSANLSGRPSPTTAEHVLEDMNGRIKCIIDGGKCDVGLESTIVDVNREVPMILRPGGITFEQIAKVLPDVESYEGSKLGMEFGSRPPPTPGLKYRHYSPNAELILYEGSDEFVQGSILKDLENYEGKCKIGVIRTRKSDSASWPSGKSGDHDTITLFIGGEDEPQEIAHNLFSSLRELDSRDVKVILMEGTSEKNEGMAIMNRVRKAASKIISM